MKKSAHIIQVVDREDIGKGQRRTRNMRPPVIRDQYKDDSSFDEESSGDESADDNNPRPPRRPRASYTRRERADKDNAWRTHQEELETAYHTREEEYRREQRNDFIVFEYMENGDLAHLIYKLLEAGSPTPRIPNRVLWSFWLCCKFEL